MGFSPYKEQISSNSRSSKQIAHCPCCGCKSCTGLSRACVSALCGFIGVYVFFEGEAVEWSEI